MLWLENEKGIFKNSDCIFGFLKTTVWDAGAQFLADTLTQFQLGGADSTHSVLHTKG